MVYDELYDKHYQYQLQYLMRSVPIEEYLPEDSIKTMAQETLYSLYFRYPVEQYEQYEPLRNYVHCP